MAVRILFILEFITSLLHADLVEKNHDIEPDGNEYTQHRREGHTEPAHHDIPWNNPDVVFEGILWKHVASISGFPKLSKHDAELGFAEKRAYKGSSLECANTKSERSLTPIIVTEQIACQQLPYYCTTCATTESSTHNDTCSTCGGNSSSPLLPALSVAYLYCTCDLEYYGDSTTLSGCSRCPEGTQRLLTRKSSNVHIQNSYEDATKEANKHPVFMPGEADIFSVTYKPTVSSSDLNPLRAQIYSNMQGRVSLSKDCVCLPSHYSQVNASGDSDWSSDPANDPGALECHACPAGLEVPGCVGSSSGIGGGDFSARDCTRYMALLESTGVIGKHHCKCPFGTRNITSVPAALAYSVMSSNASYNSTDTNGESYAMVPAGGSGLGDLFSAFNNTTNLTFSCESCPGNSFSTFPHHQDCVCKNTYFAQRNEYGGLVSCTQCPSRTAAWIDTSTGLVNGEMITWDTNMNPTYNSWTLNAYPGHTSYDVVSNEAQDVSGCKCWARSHHYLACESNPNPEDVVTSILKSCPTGQYTVCKACPENSEMKTIISDTHTSKSQCKCKAKHVEKYVGGEFIGCRPRKNCNLHPYLKEVTSIDTESLHWGTCGTGADINDFERTTILKDGEFCTLRCSPRRDAVDTTNWVKTVPLRVDCDDGEISGPGNTIKCSKEAWSTPVAIFFSFMSIAAVGAGFMVRDRNKDIVTSVISVEAESALS